MNLNFSELREKCGAENKPIKELIVELTEGNSSKINLSVIASWISEESASESLDYLINCIENLFEKSVIKNIDAIFLYGNRQGFELKQTKGFRKLGIFH